MNRLGTNEGRIVVGVDGSDESLSALRWALREATLREARLVAVTAWHDPSSYDLGHPYPSDLEKEEQAAQSTLDQAIQAVADEPGAEAIVREVIEGLPSSTLCRMADDADLLVLGARGRGGMASLLVGSVADWCVHHSVAPVVIVPAAGTRRSPT